MNRAEMHVAMADAAKYLTASGAHLANGSDAHARTCLLTSLALLQIVAGVMPWVDQPGPARVRLSPRGVRLIEFTRWQQRMIARIFDK